MLCYLSFPRQWIDIVTIICKLFERCDHPTKMPIHRCPRTNRVVSCNRTDQLGVLGKRPFRSTRYQDCPILETHELRLQVPDQPLYGTVLRDLENARV
jgi:hypothetical protein